MLKPLGQYIRDEAAPRWRNIFLTWESAITVSVIIVFWIFGNSMFCKFPKVSDIVTGGIAYAAIALGFCIAGLTISLTLPEPHFIHKLAASGKMTNAYSDLLFVFSWTAILHWCAVVVMFLIALLSDGSTSLLPPGSSVMRTCIVSFTAGLFAYCLCQFLITIITSSQVGRVYIKFLADNTKI